MEESQMNSVPFRLYLVSDRARMGPDPAGAVAALVHAGLAAFQWREKDLSPAENLESLREIFDAVRGPVPGSASAAGYETTPAGNLPGAPGALSPGVQYPWQFTPRTPPRETVEPPIHHRSPHGGMPGTTTPAADGAPAMSGAGDPAVSPDAHQDRIREESTDVPPFHLFVNDRADLALAVGCHLHLAESSIPTAVARSILPAARLVGRSTHTIEGARHAARGGADFVTFGPVYDTASKRGHGSPQGVERLREVCAAVPVPVFAIGGVTVDRIAECLQAGARGVAMIGAVWDDPDPAAALRRCLDAVAGF
jgi:thiamine-phosphate pyrophosphorylase